MTNTLTSADVLEMLAKFHSECVGPLVQQLTALQLKCDVQCERIQRLEIAVTMREMTEHGRRVVADFR